MRSLDPSALLVRATALYVPILLVLALAVRVRPSRRRIAGALLATSWNVPALLALNLVAVRAEWWTFQPGTAAVSGVPADLWIGWALLWGAVPLLATTSHLVAAGLILVAVDLVLMPLGQPVVVLNGTWLFGEAVAVATCLLPGLLLGRWTMRDEAVRGRSLLQVVGFTGLLGFVLPSLVFTATGEGWAPLLSRPRWHFVLAAVILAPVGAMAIQAVREFAAHGGTPVPLDPPRAVVTTGPYAYVANPMQLGATILLAAWGFLLSSPAVAAAAAMAAAFSAGIAAVDESRELSARFGDRWHDYRRHTRVWWPAWRPQPAAGSMVYVAQTCGPCSEVGRFILARRPVGLEVRAAETCPFPLERITYVRAEAAEVGLAAVGRSLEHVNLAWAAASWIARLPVIDQVLQLIADAVGFGPRSIGQPSVRPVSESEAPPSPAS